MKRKATVSRWITLLLAAVTLAAFAGTASADRGFRRFKGVDRGYGRERVVIRDHSSGAGPAIAGLIGGFILGTAVSQSHPVVVHEHRYCEEPVYRYYDPYGEQYYDSLDECGNDYYAPRVIEVIDVRSGRCVRRLRHRDGMWVSVGARF